jgi:hypothetical protein
VFETKEEASTYISDVIAKSDPDHDVLVADMYKFLVLPVDHTKIETKYREEYLDELFDGYKKTQHAAKTYMKTRPPDMEHPSLTANLETTTHPTELKAMNDTEMPDVADGAGVEDGAGPSGS